VRPGTFFPFLTGHAISLELQTSSQGTSSSASVVDAYTDAPPAFSVSVNVEIDREAAEDLAFEPPDASLLAVLRLRSISSQKRFIVKLPNLSDRVETIEFDRNEWMGSVSITALLLLRRQGSQLGGDLAQDAGSIVAWSDDVTVHFDEPQSALPGDHLDVRWASFAESDELSRWRDHLFSITTDNPPRILLNSDVPLAHAVLTSKGTTGRKARIRDVTFFQIAHQAWTSMIANAIDNLGEVIDEESDSSPREDLAQLEDHEQRMLEDWAPFLYSGLDIESSLERLHEAAKTRRVDDAIIRRLPHAIQHRLKTYRGFEGLVKDAGLFEEGDG